MGSPEFESFEDRLLRQIAVDEILGPRRKPGSKIASVLTMAKRYGATRYQVLKALRKLSEEGHLALKSKSRSTLKAVAGVKRHLFKEKTILLILPPSDYVYHRVLVAVAAMANEWGCVLQVLHTSWEDHPGLLSQMSKTLDQGRLCGVLLCMPTQALHAREEWFLKSLRLVNIPVVTLDNQVTGCSSVRINHADGMAKILEAVQARGHERVCYFGPTPLHPWEPGKARLDRYLEWIRGRGVPSKIGCFRPGRGILFDQNRKGAWRSEIRRRIRENKTTAWICFNDYVAMELLLFLSKDGVRIPEQAAIIGYDSASQYHFINTKIASVNPFPERQGELAMKVILEYHLQKESDFERHLSIRPEFVPGTTL